MCYIVGCKTILQFEQILRIVLLLNRNVSFKDLLHKSDEILSCLICFNNSD